MTETEAIRQNYELGVMAGEAREQQRIIKLLEGALVIRENLSESWDFGYTAALEDSIVRIKGEK